MPLAADLDRWIAPLGVALAHFLWQGTLVALVAWAAMTLARSPRGRYAIGCAALALMFALPIATLARIGPDATRASPVAPDAPAPPSLSSAGAYVRRPAAQVDRPADPTLRERLAPVSTPIVAAWLGGVALVATWHLVGLARVARLRRTAVPIDDDRWRARVRAIADRLRLRRAVALCATARLDCPAVVGAIRPVILWPAAALTGLTPAQVDALLAHELAHVARHDYLVNLLQTLVETLLFYHPAVWWISRRVRAEREHCCDDLAARAVGDRVVYAGALAAMERLRRTPSPALGADDGPLLSRVRRLLAPSPAVGVGRLALVLQLATLGLVIALFAMRPRGDGPRPRAVDSGAAPAAVADATRAVRAGDRLAVTLPVPIDVRTLRPLLGGRSGEAQLLDVDARGQIELLPPHAGGPMRAVPVAGLTPDAVARAIDARLGGDAAGTTVRVEGAADATAAMTAHMRPGADAIAPGDLVRVTIHDLVGPGRVTAVLKRVSERGTVTLPYLNQVPVAGLDSAEAEQAIAREYANAAVLARAQVDVLIVQSADGRVTVPAGLLAGTGDDVAIDQRAIDLQATIDAMQAQIAALKRASDAATRPATTRADERAIAAREPFLARLIQTRDETAIELIRLEQMQGKDSPVVVRTRSQIEALDERIAQIVDGLAREPATRPVVGEYYIGGHVVRAGAYSLNGRAITLKQALIAAGGLDADLTDPAGGEKNFTARGDVRITLIRRDPAGGPEQRITRDWNALFDGKDADVPLSPDDQIIVGTLPRTTAPATTRASDAR